MKKFFLLIGRAETTGKGRQEVVFLAAPIISDRSERGGDPASSCWDLAI